jgi:hypothetical protein
VEKNMEEFRYLLQKENWDEVCVPNEPNTSFNIFMDTFLYYFNIVFPVKDMYVKESIVKKWIIKDIIVSRTKLRLLYNMRRSLNLSMESIKYIQNYRLIYREAIKEAKRRDADTRAVS